MYVFELEEPEAVGAVELLPPDSKRDDHVEGIAHVAC